MERHLAAFKAIDGNARTRLGTLLATAAGLALAGTDATAHAHTALAGAIIVGNFVQLGHNMHSLSLLSR